MGLGPGEVERGQWGPVARVWAWKGPDTHRQGLATATAVLFRAHIKMPFSCVPSSCPGPSSQVQIWSCARILRSELLAGRMAVGWRSEPSADEEVCRAQGFLPAPQSRLQPYGPVPVLRRPWLPAWSLRESSASQRSAPHCSSLGRASFLRAVFLGATAQVQSLHTKVSLT